VLFDTQYWVDIEASDGGYVSASQGTAATPALLTGWYPAGTNLLLSATPSGDNLFTSWNGTVGVTTEASTSVAVNGPVHEVATFQPPQPVAKQQAGFFGSALGWAVFAVVGLVVGIGIAMLLFGRRRPPAPEGTDEGMMAESETPESPGELENPGGDQ